MEDKILVMTDAGPLWITPTLLALWNLHGWPEKPALRRMVEGQRNEHG